MREKPASWRILIGAGVVLLLLIFWQWGLLPLWAGDTYQDSGQNLGGDITYDVALGDVDGDDDVDVFAGNSLNNRLWLNNGNGLFSNSNQAPGTADSRGVALAHLNGDTYLDAFVANWGADNEVWLNDGGGVFIWQNQVMNPGANSLDVALADLDDDNDVDAFVANDGANEVWLNDSAAAFTRTQTLTLTHTSREVALVDVDGDDDLDAYVANGNSSGQGDELWLNAGNGAFSDSDQSLSTSWNEGAALADLDGDGDPDLFLAAWFGDDAVWLNQGGAQGGIAGTFADSGQTLSGDGSTDVALLDVDNDDDLDAIVAKYTPYADEIWLNDGEAHFSLSEETLDSAATYEVGVADLDGDQDADLFFANFGANHVWFRGGFPLPVAWLDVDARSNDDGQTVYPWAQSHDATLPISLSFAPGGAVDVNAGIQSPNSTLTQTIPFAPGQDSGQLIVDNPHPAVSEMVTITLGVETQMPLVWRSLVNPLGLVFINAAAGDESCFLCFADWEAKLMGFETSFWALHDAEIAGLNQSASWGYYEGQFGSYAAEMAGLLAADPGLLWATLDMLETWTPAVQALDDGMGDAVVVTQPMVDEMMTVLAEMQVEASPALAARLQSERDLLGVDSWAGMTMNELREQIDARVSRQLFLPLFAAP